MTDTVYDKLRDELIERIRYHKNGPMSRGFYELRFNGRLYLNTDTQTLVDLAMDYELNAK